MYKEYSRIFNALNGAASLAVEVMMLMSSGGIHAPMSLISLVFCLVLCMVYERGQVREDRKTWIWVSFVGSIFFCVSLVFASMLILFVLVVVDALSSVGGVAAFLSLANGVLYGVRVYLEGPNLLHS